MIYWLLLLCLCFIDLCMRIVLHLWSQSHVVLFLSCFFANKPSILYIDEGIMNENHYNDVIMSAMASQIISLTIVYLSVC